MLPLRLQAAALSALSAVASAVGTARAPKHAAQEDGAVGGGGAWAVGPVPGGVAQLAPGFALAPQPPPLVKAEPGGVPGWT